MKYTVRYQTLNVRYQGTLYDHITETFSYEGSIRKRRNSAANQLRKYSYALTLLYYEAISDYCPTSPGVREDKQRYDKKVYPTLKVILT